MVSENCARCGKPLEKALCADCVKAHVEEEVELISERMIEIQQRIEAIEGEIVRLQTKLMQLR